MSSTKQSYRFFLSVFIPFFISSIFLITFLILSKQLKYQLLILLPFFNGILIPIIYKVSDAKYYQKIFGANIVNLWSLYIAVFFILSFIPNYQSDDGTKAILFMLFYPFFNVFMLISALFIMIVGNLIGFVFVMHFANDTYPKNAGLCDNKKVSQK